MITLDKKENRNSRHEEKGGRIGGRKVEEYSGIRII